MKDWGQIFDLDRFKKGEDLILADPPALMIECVQNEDLPNFFLL